MGQEQERHLNMTQTSVNQCGTRQKKSTAMVTPSRKRSKNQSQFDQRDVISARVKPDEQTAHGRNNSGKASNHQRINDQCKTAIRFKHAVL